INLNSLFLGENRIKKIEGLDNLNKLNYLKLAENEIEKIEGLDNLINLTDINLRKNKISKIEGLEHLLNLKRLDLTGNGNISKIEKLSTLTKLNSLYLEDNRIITIEGLDGLVNLTSLNLDMNRIKQIENISHLVSLERLYLSSNQIKRIHGLETLINLTLLHLENNQISRIDGLNGLDGRPLPCLEKLFIKGNPTADIRSLGDEVEWDEDGSVKDLRFVLGLLERIQVQFLEQDEIELYLLEYRGAEKEPIEYPIFGNFGKASIPFRSNRKDPVLDFVVRIRSKEQSKLEHFRKACFEEAITDRGDPLELVFDINSFHEMVQDGDYYVRKSKPKPTKIDSDYKLYSGIILLFFSLKVNYQSADGTEMEQDLPLKHHVKYVSLGGRVGRFFDNIMARLVFVSLITSLTGFFATKLGLLDPNTGIVIEWIGYAIVGIAIISALAMYMKESKDYRQNIKRFETSMKKEKEGQRIS
ncbi:MAG: leucine-rich repeat domain-containing protein, partial [Candidatus Lokiarchaeota archaeon]|nr:leucine-rich repeat domain-containing protein [Candidatus Lokiarchaeota archaeon]